MAASKRGYLPGIIANLHIAHFTRERDYYTRYLSSFPNFVQKNVIAFAALTAELRIQEEVPMSVIISILPVLTSLLNVSF